MKEKTLSVSAIKDGTVIDHIQPGAALKIMNILQLYAENRQVTIGINLKGASGLKDIIKIENVLLTETQAAQIAVFSPHATVNVIQNYQVTKKFKVQIPEKIDSLLACPNTRCIGNSEKIATLFLVEESGHQVTLRCKYCEKRFTRDQMHEKALM
ncbi:MAG: aspartate carbamoyltransferase regulatory subunit [Verrucomicrobia bacterium]|nr:aspartate carbamoyltransferase regulatory subunit [Verrucomicrobiota bacterium]